MGQYVVAIIYTFEIFKKKSRTLSHILSGYVSRPNDVDVVLHMGPFFFFLLILKYFNILNMYNIYSVIRTVMHSFKSGICAYMQVNYSYEFLLHF